MGLNEAHSAIDLAQQSIDTYQEQSQAAHKKLSEGGEHILGVVDALTLAIDGLRLAEAEFTTSASVTAGSRESVVKATQVVSYIEGNGTNFTGSILTNLNTTTDRLEGLSKGSLSFAESAAHYLTALLAAQEEMRSGFLTAVEHNSKSLLPHTGQNPAHFTQALEQLKKDI